MKMTNDVQAALLLTSRFTGMSETDVQLLTTREWNRLSVWLRDRGMKSGDLLVDDPLEILRDWNDPGCQRDRIQRLLNRGMALSLALEKWQRAGIWILARSEPDYPRRLKEFLKELSSPIIFGYGNVKLLETGGIAVVGSRNASAEDDKFALSLGDKLARSGKSVVSGGARGIDQAAMLGAIEADGTVVGVLADSLLKMSVSQKYRQALHRQDLVLVSPFHPEAGFNVGNAMARNKYIYCLSDLAVAVHSGTSGGTWNGAIENLKNRWVPLWVKRTTDRKAGNGELVQRGAMWLPERLLEDDMQNLHDWLPDEGRDLPTMTDSFATAETQAVYRESKDVPLILEEGIQKTDDGRKWTEKSLYEMFCLKLGRLLAGAGMQPKEIEEQVGLTDGQLKIWLKQAVDEGLIAKRDRPLRYELAKAKCYTQEGLFDQQ